MLPTAVFIYLVQVLTLVTTFTKILSSPRSLRDPFSVERSLIGCGYLQASLSNMEDAAVSLEHKSKTRALNQLRQIESQVTLASHCETAEFKVTTYRRNSDDPRSTQFFWSFRIESKDS